VRYHGEVLQLLVESFPSTLVRKCNGYIVRVWKLVETMLEQRDTTLKAWQHIVAKVESFLKTHMPM
jgi:hypothetical protein